MHNSNIFGLTLVLCGICVSAQVIKMYIDRTMDTFNHLHALATDSSSWFGFAFCFI